MTKVQEVKKAKNNETHTFYQGGVFKVIIKAALPIVIMMLFNALYTMIDTMLAGVLVQYPQLADGTQLNGSTVMGPIIPLVNLLFAFPTAFAVAGGLAYTQAVARQDKVEAQKRFSSAFSLVLIFGISIIVLNLILYFPYMNTATDNWDWTGQGSWEGNSKKMLMQGFEYSVILTLSFTFMNFNQLIIRVLRPEGKGVATTLIPIASLPINLMLDYLLMNENLGNLGLAGAGIATLVASLITTLIAVSYTQYSGSRNKLEFKLSAPAKTVTKSMFILLVAFGTSSFVRRVFDAGINMTMASTIDNMSVKWHTAMTAMTRSMNMSMTISLGIAQALSMLNSFYYNDGNKERLKKTAIYGFQIAVFSQIFLSLFLFLIQEWLFIGFGADWNSFAGNYLTVRMAYLFIMLYTVTSTIQLIPVMFYAGTKSSRQAIIHASTYGTTEIIFIVIGFILTKSIGGGSKEIISQKDICLFAFIFLGSLFGSTGLLFYYSVWFKNLLNNSERLNKKAA